MFRSATARSAKVFSRQARNARWAAATFSVACSGVKASKRAVISSVAGSMERIRDAVRVIARGYRGERGAPARGTPRSSALLVLFEDVVGLDPRVLEGVLGLVLLRDDLRERLVRGVTDVLVAADARTRLAQRDEVEGLLARRPLRPVVLQHLLVRRRGAYRHVAGQRSPA